MMKCFFFFGHPAQFHFYKNIVKVLREKGCVVRVYIKKKDVLESLIKETGWDYTNISPEGRGKSKYAIFYSLLKRDIRIFWEVIKHKPDLLIASDPSFSHAGFLFGIPCLNFVDDDFDVTGYYPVLTYPFTSTLITPDTVKTGRWEHKKVSYKGYMKLAYLHPNWFKPDPAKIGNLPTKSYYLIRLSGLEAHHDAREKGISITLLDNIIKKISGSGTVIISSEGELPAGFERYKKSIPIIDMHHYLAFAKILISDSQSMTGEAAVLGVPSIRISSFKGKLSVLEELEHRYGLTFAFQPEDKKDIFNKIDEFLETSDLESLFQKCRQMMLSEKIDVTAFCIWFIENYPGSRKIVQQNPDYPNNFK